MDGLKSIRYIKGGRVERYGRYQIIEELGRGSMGVVYKAYDPEIDRSLALKILRPDRVTSKAFVDRFLKEARAIGRLSHPNIVTVYDVGQDHGTVYIAMELLEGLALSDLMKKERMPVARVADIGAQVAGALEYAHRKGIVHRDIKPSNIIVNPSGHVKLTDFGIAHIEDPNMPHQTQAGEILGTPAYMSPEQVLGRPVQGSADIFSLGIVLYEMLTGTRPFKGENLSAIFNAITQYNPSPPNKLNSQVPRQLSSAVMKCLSKEPERRFQSAGELASLLEGFKSADAVHGQTAKGPEGQGAGRRIFLWIAGMALVLFLSLGGYGLYQHFWPGQEMPAATAILDVTSVPDGSRIFVDGDFKGLTPAVLRLVSGAHNVKISHEGYYDWEARVNLKDRMTTPLKVKLIGEMPGNN